METSLPARLHIVAWSDAVIDRLGFPPQSPYSELCWLPRLGPSATLAYRRLAATLAQRPDGFDIDVAELAHSLGLGRGTGAQSPVSRTLRRLADFDLARFADERTFALRRRIPPLSRGQLRHLSAELQRTTTHCWSAIRPRSPPCEPAEVAEASVGSCVAERRGLLRRALRRVHPRGG